MSTRDRWSALQESQRALRGHHLGLEYMSALLTNAKYEMATDGYMSSELRMRIMSAFFLWDSSFAHACCDAAPPEAKSGRNPTETIEEKPADKKPTLLEKLIDHKLKWIRVLKEYASNREKVEVDAERRRYSLADKDGMDKLLRYEAHIERQIYRAMDQLERMQRRRLGEAVPPPLNVNLGRRG